MPATIATAYAENNGALYTTELQVKQHQLIADELPILGGQDLGPEPGSYLCMALASCTVITLRMYVQRKGWNVEQISAKVDLVKSEDKTSGTNTFHCEVSVTGDLTDAQRDRLLYIARACPVHKLLSKPSEMVTVLK